MKKKSPTAIKVQQTKRKYTRRSPYWDKVGTKENSRSYIKKHKGPTTTAKRNDHSTTAQLKELRRKLSLSMQMNVKLLGLMVEAELGNEE